MIKINNNIPLSKKDLIELLNKILEKDDFWTRNTIIRYIEAKQEKLFKDVDKLLEEQRNLDIKKSDKFNRWIEIQNEIGVIYRTIDNLGDGWKSEEDKRILKRLREEYERDLEGLENERY